MFRMVALPSNAQMTGEEILLLWPVHLFHLVIVITRFESSPINRENVRVLAKVLQPNWLTVYLNFFHFHLHRISMCARGLLLFGCSAFLSTAILKKEEMSSFFSLTRATLWRHICHLHVVASYSMASRPPDSRNQKDTDNLLCSQCTPNCH